MNCRYPAKLQREKIIKVKYVSIAVLVLLLAFFLLIADACATTSARGESSTVNRTEPTCTDNKSRTVTFADAEVSLLLPLKGTEAHFLPGNKVIISYRDNSIRLNIGATDGSPWAETVPDWLSLEKVDPKIFYYSYMNGGRIWMLDLPAWFDYKKYDSELNGIPFILSLETRDGAVTVKY